MKKCPHSADPVECPTCVALAQAAEAKAAGGDAYDDWLRATATATCDRQFPRRYINAHADHPDVLAWLKRYAANPTGSPSLLIVGPTGVGKTWQAYGALRRAVVTPTPVQWQAATFADFTAALRPTGRDPEGALERYRKADLLLIDDLGAAKHSEWVEEITYRLINGRYEDMLPSIFTTNVPLKATDDNGKTVYPLRDTLGDRIASRLVETCTLVGMVGVDRRRAVAA